MRIVGDCREVLRDLGKGSVQCCVTSPPYWGLRDYGVKNQIGLERTPDEFVQQMVEVFRLVREVLVDDGTLWLNLGDSYGSGTRATRDYSKTTKHGYWNNPGINKRIPAPAKQLLGMPWRVAFALQADGWYLRSDIIWHKPNPMPESVADRPTKSHEYLFLLTKNARYFYDAEAVREPHSEPWRSGKKENVGKPNDGSRVWLGYGNGKYTHRVYNPAGRNRRTVWTIATAPFKGAHFATFPPKLVEPCILAGSSEKGHCPECGARWVRVVEREFVRLPGRDIRPRDGGEFVRKAMQPGHTQATTTGWRPTCAHNRKPVPDRVLDPFGGSGTTAEVAQRLGRDWVMIELNAKYGRLIDERVKRAA